MFMTNYSTDIISYAYVLCMKTNIKDFLNLQLFVLYKHAVLLYLPKIFEMKPKEGFDAVFYLCLILIHKISI